jgi:dTDP-4-dehydrorhamnose 3,5-epimerase
MKFTKALLEDAFVVIGEPFMDHRGKFERFFCKNEYSQVGLKKEIVQINHSYTVKKGAIRGMHFQYPPKSETKIVRCLKGEVFDVIVDIRKKSKTFLKWHGEIISEKNYKAIFIPDGFAHGFQTLADECELLYFHTEFYNKSYESGLRFDDPVIDIKWPLDPEDLSERDKSHKLIDIKDFGVILK